MCRENTKKALCKLVDAYVALINSIHAEKIKVTKKWHLISGFSFVHWCRSPRNAGAEKRVMENASHRKNTIHFSY